MRLTYDKPVEMIVNDDGGIDYVEDDVDGIQ